MASAATRIGGADRRTDGDLPVGPAPVETRRGSAIQGSLEPIGLPAIRPFVLIGFGILLGWSASTMFTFYASDSRDNRGPEATSARITLPSRTPAGTEPRGAASPEVSPAPAPPVGPAFDLFGGEPASRDTVFCAVLVVDPGGCDAETSRRSAQGEAGAQAVPRPVAADLDQGGGGTRLRSRASPPKPKPNPATTSSLPRVRATVRDASDP